MLTVSQSCNDVDARSTVYVVDGNCMHIATATCSYVIGVDSVTYTICTLQYYLGTFSVSVEVHNMNNNVSFPGSTPKTQNFEITNINLPEGLWALVGVAKAHLYYLQTNF